MQDRERDPRHRFSGIGDESRGTDDGDYPISAWKRVSKRARRQNNSLENIPRRYENAQPVATITSREWNYFARGATRRAKGIRTYARTPRSPHSALNASSPGFDAWIRDNVLSITILQFIGQARSRLQIAFSGRNKQRYSGIYLKETTERMYV